ncbi:hypothetical protein M0G43_12050 [Subsaxibacter sp. CAU 1640]|uniref:hypothetical protein n=1 Tax=Subsaxibacter sp. CAU 1640 TaxID=2933271 RepID=UPI002003A0C3|nr:hypothetical protein [Subsaxibacter sp. CAU 1640]MCK7591310.1 hypothetical protein [Subsaxibacter sp. CAU 1640]
MIQLLNSEKDNVIAAILEGKISKTDVESIHSRIHQILKTIKKSISILKCTILKVIP